MKGKLNDVTVFSIPMINNVWRVNTKDLFSNIVKNLPEESARGMWWIDSQVTKEFANMLNSNPTKFSEGDTSENSSSYLNKNDLVISKKVELLHQRLFHRGR